MDNIYLNNDKYSLRSRLILMVWFVFFLYIDSGVIRLISPGLRSQDAWASLIVSWVVGTIWFVQIQINLQKIHQENAGQPFRSLGLPNTLTILRGFLIAVFSGLAVVPRLPASINWLPGLIFLTAVTLDGIDGIVARLTARTTALGERLDMEMDSITVLAGSIAACISGSASLLILLSGSARYLFIGGEWLLKKTGRPVNPTRQKPLRRALAGLMMGFLAVSLFPVFFSPALKVVSYFIIVPFLLNFLDDWFQVCGFEFPSREKIMQMVKNGKEIANRWLLPGFRLFIILLTMITLVQVKQISALSDFTLGIIFILSIALLTGTAGRLSAVGFVLLISLETNGDTFVVPILLILVSSCIIFLLGTGRFSIWKPEDILIFHRIGEHDQS